MACAGHAWSVALQAAYQLESITSASVTMQHFVFLLVRHETCEARDRVQGSHHWADTQAPW